VADITEAIEQEAIADTLVAPLQSISEAQEAPESGIDDGLENALDQPSDELGETQDDQPKADELQPLSEQEQAALMESQEAFEALPEAEQFQQCTESLSQKYAEVQASLDPETCQQWAAKLAADSGFPGLEGRFDPVALATVAETATSGFEETLRYHPAAPAFREAVGEYYSLSPEQRQTPEGAQLYDAAVRAAMPLNSRTMALAVLNDLGVVLNQPNLPYSGNPLALVAQLEVELAEDAGWLGASQPTREEHAVGRPGSSRSIFKTNVDLFDDQAMEEVARRGLL